MVFFVFQLNETVGIMTLMRVARLGLYWISLGALATLFAPSAVAERVFLAGYNGGFYIRSEQEGGMALRLGGSFESDYRYYMEDQRADNRFDIRQARLIFRGELTRWFRFGMEYEFQGNETDNLVDAWGEAVYQNHGIRFGQFKQPFSYQWQTPNKAQLFAERSIGYSLGPKRDIGLMLKGSVTHQRIHYAVGLFNGDGDDGETRGSENDESEIAGRLVVQPLANSSHFWLRGIQLGASASSGQIDTLNVNLRVKSTGMWGTNRNLYQLTHNTKFGVLTDAGQRLRYGAEATWAMGPVLLAAEYMQLTYSDLKVSGQPNRDAQFSSAYASLAWCVTGEHFSLQRGALQAVHPNRYFNPEEGSWGALVLAVRYDHFNGDKNWITSDANVSVEQANALSAAANWVLFPMIRIVVDVTHTEFSDKLRVRIQSDGTVDTIDEENVFTFRLCMDF